MDTARQDFLIGLLLVTAIAVVVGALIATSGWGERRYALYLRMSSAAGVSVDTRVFVQGLEIGRVQSVVPRVAPGRRTMSFLARLSIAETFADGSRLELPRGTTAVIEPVSQISSAAAIRLVLPDSTAPFRGFLAADDTIASVRPPSTFDAIADVAARLEGQVEDVLHTASRAIASIDRTFAAARETIRGATPGLDSTVAGLAVTARHLASVSTRADTALADSMLVTLAGADRLLAHLDSLTGDARALTARARPDLEETVTSLRETARQLEHFVDAASRRPYRMLTGVAPLPPDPAPRPAPKDSVKP